MTSETQFLQVFWHKILSLNFVQNNGGAFCMRGSGRQGNIPTLRLPVFHGKMRKQKAGSVVERRRKATLPAVLGTPEHCGLIRRDLVVCPPFWLLPRIETGDSFFMGLLCAAAAAAPAGKCACMGFCGENLSEVMGEVRSVLPECTLIMPDNRGNSLW